jgi:hypothetical protein
MILALLQHAGLRAEPTTPPEVHVDAQVIQNWLLSEANKIAAELSAHFSLGSIEQSKLVLDSGPFIILSDQARRVKRLGERYGIEVDIKGTIVEPPDSPNRVRDGN